MQVRTDRRIPVYIELGPYGNFSCYIEETFKVDLKVGDVIWEPRQKYHGVVREKKESGMSLVHWYKWDPAIEMPMREYIFSPGSVMKIVEVHPRIPGTTLDLKAFERGGPYN